MRVTKSKDNIVYTIDNINIVELYKKYLGEDIATLLPESGIEFPIIFKRNGVNIARAPIAKLDDGSLVFDGNIEVLKDRSDYNFNIFKQYPIETIFIYSCSARKAFLGKNLEYELEMLNQLAPLCGFFTYGEYLHSEKLVEILNITTTFLTLSESKEISSKKQVIKESKKIDTTFNALLHLVSTTSNELKEDKEKINNYNLDLTHQLKDQKELLENVTNSTSDIIFYKDIDFKYIGCNNEFEKFTGKSKDEIVGKDDYQLFSKDIANLFRIMDTKMLKQGTSNTNYEWVKYPDGSDIYLLTTKSPLKDENGITFGIVGISRDMTNEYNLEEEKNNALKLNSAKSQFLANMSHEIRTPLNSILGFIDILKDEVKSKKALEYLNIVDKSGKHLQNIINDILDFSKIETGKLQIDKISFNPIDTFNEISDMFINQSKDKNIYFNIQIDKTLPKEILCDKLRLQQIIINLLSNAFKFTPKNGTVFYKIEYKNKRILVNIKDAEIGISSDKLSTIFEPFSQEDGSTTREYGGTGLGLSICSELVKLLDGELCVKSIKDIGSEFYFDIPITISNENNNKNKRYREKTKSKKNKNHSTYSKCTKR
ncbi:MAG: ATP-binding protein [Campylobacterota bacterium]|nr:ATP-binding protein [Campylobacterota bacterium]